MDETGPRVGSPEDLIRELLASFGVESETIDTIVDFASDFIDSASEGLQGLMSSLSKLGANFVEQGPDRK